MTNEAIEAAARAMCEASPFDDDKPSDYYAEVRAAVPALMEEGARLALEAAAEVVDDREFHAFIRALDPAAIVKGAGHDRD